MIYYASHREWVRFSDGIPLPYARLQSLYSKGSDDNEDCKLNYDFSWLEAFMTRR